MPQLSEEIFNRLLAAMAKAFLAHPEDFYEDEEEQKQSA